MKHPTAVCALVAASALGIPRTARAEDTLKSPGDHSHYFVEMEPHGVGGWAAQWAGLGFGLGGRLSVNLTHDGFIPTINNSVAVSLGFDWLHYAATQACYYANGICSFGPGYYPDADYFQFPVAMQWNFYLSKRWSVFGEPGLYIWHGSYSAPSYACNGAGQTLCTVSYGADTGVGPAFWAGARYHFSDAASLTVRVGYPDFLTVGASFFP
jgi:hypothetical protein